MQEKSGSLLDMVRCSNRQTSPAVVIKELPSYEGNTIPGMSVNSVSPWFLLLEAKNSANSYRLNRHLFGKVKPSSESDRSGLA